MLFPSALATYNRIIQKLGPPALIIGSICRFHHGSQPQNTERGDNVVEVLQYTNFLARDRSLVESCSQIVIKKSVADKVAVFRSENTAFPYDSCDIILSLACSGSCVAVTYPTTVAYRYHDSNNSADLSNMIQSATRLIGLVQGGKYVHGGRRFARYSYLGGIEISYLRRALLARRPDLMFKVLKHSFPMILASLVRKTLLIFHRKVRPTILADN